MNFTLHSTIVRRGQPFSFLGKIFQDHIGSVKLTSLQTITRADAFPTVDRYDFSKVVETQTFVDAIIYLCLKPQDAANFDDLVHYERPQVEPEPEQVQEVTEVEGIEQALGQLSVDGSELDSVSDVSTVSESSATEDIATAVTAASLPRAGSSGASHGTFLLSPSSPQPL